MLKWIKENKHCLLMLYFAFYFPTFYLLEWIVEPKYWIECSIDHMIPFCEWFVIPYSMWGISLFGSLFYFMFKDARDFKRLCFMMFGSATIALITYAIFPNGVNLRVPIVNDNIAADICRFMQKADTPTNVCPSIHVSTALAIDLAVQTSQIFRKKKIQRAISMIFTVIVCASTVFLKQHSIIDVVCGAGVTLVLFGLTYTNKMKKLFEGKKQEETKEEAVKAGV